MQRNISQLLALYRRNRRIKKLKQLTPLVVIFLCFFSSCVVFACLGVFISALQEIGVLPTTTPALYTSTIAAVPNMAADLTIAETSGTDLFAFTPSPSLPIETRSTISPPDIPFPHAGTPVPSSGTPIPNTDPPTPVSPLELQGK